MRKQLLWSSLLAASFALGSSAQQPSPEPRIVDLESIGYPQDICKWPREIQIEFLDSARLLVSFPLHSSPCNEPNPMSAEKRAAVVAVSGTVLHTLDLQPGQLLRAGPNGHILSLTEKGLNVLDSDFSVIQMLPWPKEVESGRSAPWAWTAPGNILLTPSREGFVIEGSYPNYRVTYFEGNPVKLTTANEPCPLAAVTDGGFACFEQGAKTRLVVHLANGDWSLGDSHLGNRELTAPPIPDRVLLLTSKFHFYEFQRGGGIKELADLHWLAPGLLTSGLRYEVTSSTAQRILVASWGCWFPLNDTTGIGYYERVAVLDYSSGEFIFRKQCSIGSDVTISPDGHLLAIREKNRLSLVTLP
jgi:hypothetical protein